MTNAPASPAPAFGDDHDEDDGALVDAFWRARLTPALLDDALPAPLYHQIYLVLRKVAREADQAKHHLLPGEQTLARLFAVSRITVKRALNELAAENIVSRHRGRGTIITPQRTMPVVRSSFDDLMQSLKEMGLVTSVELLEANDLSAGEAGVAEQMALPAETPVQRAVRRRMLEGEPLSYLVSYTPRAIANHYSLTDLAHASFLTLLDRAGVKTIEAEQWITAVAADPHVASALELSPSQPLLKIERVMRGEDGQTVQLLHGFYRPDRFQYHVKNHGLRSRD